MAEQFDTVEKRDFPKVFTGYEFDNTAGTQWGYKDV